MTKEKGNVQNISLDKTKIYQSKLIGENGIYRVRIVNILEKTVVVELIEGVAKLALAKKSEIKELRTQ